MKLCSRGVKPLLVIRKPLRNIRPVVGRNGRLVTGRRIRPVRSASDFDFTDEEDRVHVDLPDKDDVTMDVYRQQWTLLTEYMLEEGLFPTAKTVEQAQIYAEKKKAVLNLARQQPDLLMFIPREALVNIAANRLVGGYERKVLNAYVRFQDTYRPPPRVPLGDPNERASLQDLMRLLLRASELATSRKKLPPRSKEYVQACSEALSWLLIKLKGAERRDIITLEPF